MGPQDFHQKKIPTKSEDVFFISLEAESDPLGTGPVTVNSFSRWDRKWFAVQITPLAFSQLYPEIDLKYFSLLRASLLVAKDSE